MLHDPCTTETLNDKGCLTFITRKFTFYQVLLAYLKVSKGQIRRRANGLITIELTGLITVVATTAAATTVTTLEPTTPLPDLNPPGR